jgi:membrane dipeptidase
MRLSWNDLGTPRADLAQGETVEIAGWVTTALSVKKADHFLLTAEPNCCAGCVPGNPLAVVEVLTEQTIEMPSGALRLAGTLVLGDDPMGISSRARGPRV